jgi:hypothetical protein
LIWIFICIKKNGRGDVYLFLAIYISHLQLCLLKGAGENSRRCASCTRRATWETLYTRWNLPVGSEGGEHAGVRLSGNAAVLQQIADVAALAGRRACIPTSGKPVLNFELRLSQSVRTARRTAETTSERRRTDYTTEGIFINQ